MLQYNKLKHTKERLHMKNKHKILYFLPAIIVTLIIFALSSRDIDTSNAQSGQVTEAVVSLFGSSSGYGSSEGVGGIDFGLLNLYIRALAHVIEFGGLGLMILLGCFLNKLTLKQYIKITLTWGIATALVDETIQYFTPGRTCDLLDITKDIIGILLSLVFAYVVQILYLRHTNKTKKKLLQNLYP